MYSQGIPIIISVNLGWNATYFPYTHGAISSLYCIIESLEFIFLEVPNYCLTFDKFK